MTRSVRRRPPLLAAAVAWSLAGVGYLAAEAVAASAFPGYSYTGDYISDLGVPGPSPLAAVMNAGFVWQGLLFAAAGILVFKAGCRGRAPFLVLALVHGLGNVLVAVVHSDAAADGWHVAGAGMAIVGGNAAVVAAGLGLWGGYRVASVVIGFAGLASLLALASGSPVGVWERGSVYTIIGWELLAATAVFVSSASKKNSQGSPSSTSGSTGSSSRS